MAHGLVHVGHYPPGRAHVTHEATQGGGVATRGVIGRIEAMARQGGAWAGGGRPVGQHCG